MWALGGRLPLSICSCWLWWWCVGLVCCPCWVLLKPSMYKWLDPGEGYIGCIGGFTNIEMRQWSLVRPDLVQSIFWIPCIFGWELSSLYTCNTILHSGHYIIHYSAISKTTTAHYQSAVSLISFTQVWTAQWSDTIPSQNVWFQVGIHLTLFHFNTPTKPNYSMIIWSWT